MLKSAGIEMKGVFLNADSGFDDTTLRQLCERKQIQANIKSNSCNTKQESLDYHHFDEELYKQRSAIERENAWMDSFKALLVRFETLASAWIALHLLAFTVLLMRKINKHTKV